VLGGHWRTFSAPCFVENRLHFSDALKLDSQLGRLPTCRFSESLEVTLQLRTLGLESARLPRAPLAPFFAPTMFGGRQ
jgi:hypothetical protein